jgi:hypothetical protein
MTLPYQSRCQTGNHGRWPILGDGGAKILVAHGVLLTALAGFLVGCGSEDPDKIPRLRGSMVRRPVTQETRRKIKPENYQNSVEVIPPERSGQRGLTRAELDDRLGDQPDPRTIEVIPPERSGQRGFTQAQLDDRLGDEPDPWTIEVIPPERSGQRGLTQAQLGDGLSDEPDPHTIEVIPPERSGQRGLTREELKAVGQSGH